MTTVETVRGPERFAALRDEWNALADLGPRGAFRSWDWLHSWWDTFGQPQIHLGIVRGHRGQLLGVAPFYLQHETRKRVLRCETLRLLGDTDVATDGLDLIVAPGAEPVAIAALSDWLGRSDFQQALLCHTEEAQALVPLLFEGSAPRLEVDRLPCPQVALPATFEAYLATLAPHHRHAVRRRERQLERVAGAGLRTLRGTEAATAGLDALFTLHRRRWQSMERAGEDNLARPEVERFHRKAAPLLAERDLLRCLLLESNAGPIAVLYGFVCAVPEGGRCFHFFQSGHDPGWAKYSPGAVVLAASIRAAIAEGCVGFDMMRGDEGYKAHWQTGTTWLRTLRVARDGWGAALLRAEMIWRAARQSPPVQIASHGVSPHP